MGSIRVSVSTLLCCSLHRCESRVYQRVDPTRGPLVGGKTVDMASVLRCHSYVIFAGADDQNRSG